MSIDDLFSDELPADARALIEDAEREITRLQADADTDVAEVRAKADRDIDKARQKADKAIDERRERAQKAVADRLRQLLEALRPLQAAHVKEGRLDEALAIRERARQLRGRMHNARPDPGNLTEYQPEDDGTEVEFEVTGSTDGTIWGTDVYTSDSRLATACVHAGVLRAGQRGIVRATIVDGLNVTFTGSHRHGVASHEYGSYPVAYRVRRA
jgi:hypothetical protein